MAVIDAGCARHCVFVAAAPLTAQAGPGVGMKRKQQSPELEAKAARAYQIIEELGIDAFVLALLDMEMLDSDGTICDWAFEEEE